VPKPLPVMVIVCVCCGVIALTDVITGPTAPTPLTSRMRLFNASATYRLPAESKANPVGEFNRAAVAGPPSRRSRQTHPRYRRDDACPRDLIHAAGAAGICHVHIALAVGRHAPWVIQSYTRRNSAAQVSIRSPSGNRRNNACRRYLAHAGVFIIGNVEVAVRVRCKPSGRKTLAWVAGPPSPILLEFASC